MGAIIATAVARSRTTVGPRSPCRASTDEANVQRLTRHCVLDVERLRYVHKRLFPDHPLLRQPIGDCLNETMDIEALEPGVAYLDEVRGPNRFAQVPTPDSPR